VIRSQNEINSLTLFKAGISFAQRHYLLTSMYVLGLIVLQFATGFRVTTEQKQVFDHTLSQIDVIALEKAKELAYLSKFSY
jgi:hypothetical protein